MNTALGLLAIVFWSTTFGLVRSLTEQLGTLTAATCIYLIAGIIGCGYLAARPKQLSEVFRLPFLHLAGRGSLFVTYVVCVYLAIGLAATRQQVIEVALINYLWPGLTLVFSVPILKHRARPWLAPGIVIAFAGAAVAITQGSSFSWGAFSQGLRTGSVPYLCAFCGAIAWALYSNLSRRWASDAQSGPVPLFLLASALVLAALRCLFPEDPDWTLRAGAELLCMALFPAFLAYLFWDAAMRKGAIVLVVALSYLAPLLSAIVAALYLGVPLSWRLGVACALIIAGAAICKLSLVEHDTSAGKAAKTRIGN